MHSSGKGRDTKPGAAETKPEAAADTGEKGYLTLDSFPWSRVSLNGRVLGTTPLIKVPLPPGTHTLTLENSDEKLNERTTVTIKAGETVSKRLAF